MTSHPQQLSFFSTLAQVETPAPEKTIHHAHTYPLLAIEERPQGTQWRVHPTEGCACGEDTPQEPCWHHKRALDLWGLRSGGMRFLAKSGFHKELRRGDLQQTLRWGRIAAYLHGSSWPKSYLKRILLEEGRSLSLLESWQSLANLDWRDCVRKAVAMPKLWQIPAREGTFALFVEAYRATEEEAPFLTSSALRHALQIAETSDDIWRVFWKAMRRKDRDGVIWLVDALRPVAAELGGAASLFIEKNYWDIHPFYGVKALIEIITGAWEAHADRLNLTTLQQPIADDPHLVVPAITDYLYDCHEIRGQQRLKKQWDAIHPQRPLPKGIDLRWSGMLLGLCWREYAARQYPHDFTKRRWEEVAIPSRVWQDALAADRFFFPRFYEQIAREHRKAA